MRESKWKEESHSEVEILLGGDLDIDGRELFQLTLNSLLRSADNEQSYLSHVLSSRIRYK